MAIIIDRGVEKPPTKPIEDGDNGDYLTATLVTYEHPTLEKEELFREYFKPLNVKPPKCGFRGDFFILFSYSTLEQEILSGFHYGPSGLAPNPLRTPEHQKAWPFIGDVFTYKADEYHTLVRRNVDPELLLLIYDNQLKKNPSLTDKKFVRNLDLSYEAAKIAMSAKSVRPIPQIKISETKAIEINKCWNSSNYKSYEEQISAVSKSYEERVKLFGLEVNRTPVRLLTKEERNIIYDPKNAERFDLKPSDKFY